jgi:hypothetical protein
MAQANMFQVILPPIAGSSLSANEINILCSSATLPGRQIQTVDRFIGTISEKVATGSISDDLSFTFKVLNDYGIRKYFETWQDLAYNQTTQQIGYKKDYCKQVIVNQLKKGQGFPLIDASTTLFPNSPFPSIIYECKLLEAWPINMDTVTLNNDPDGLVEVTVQLAYTRWSSRYIN